MRPIRTIYPLSVALLLADIRITVCVCQFAPINREVFVVLKAVQCVG